MRILVTGANGFIGSHVVDNLLQKNHNVTIFDRFKEKKPIWKNVNFYLGDIKDKEAIFDAVGTHDASIHLAGILGTSETADTPIESINVNITGAINYYEALKKHKKPAVTITVGNYTWNNTYAITKYTAERFAIMYNKEFKIKIAIVRGLNVYGERQKHAPIRKVIPNFIIKALKNDPIEIYGDGEQLIDLVYVKDTAEILVRALLLNHNIYSSVFEAGTGKPITATELASLIIKLAKSKSKIIYLPMRVGEPYRSITQGDPSTLEPLGFRMQDFTSLSKGMLKTIAWYKKYYLPIIENSKSSITKRNNKKIEKSQLRIKSAKTK